MTIFKKAGLAVLLSMVPFHSSAIAALIESGSSSTVTLDSNQGLFWLDVTASLNRSIGDVTSNFAVGGDFQGYRYATESEVLTLFKEARVNVGARYDDFDAYKNVLALQDRIGVTARPNQMFPINDTLGYYDQGSPNLFGVGILETWINPGYNSGAVLSRDAASRFGPPVSGFGSFLVKGRQPTFEVGYDPSTQQFSFQSAGVLSDDLRNLMALKEAYGHQAAEARSLAGIATTIPTNVVNGPKEAATSFFIDRAIQELQALTGSNILGTINEIWSTFRNGATTVVASYKLQAITLLKGVENVFTTLSNDPPDNNFHVLAQRPDVALDPAFATRFGAQFAPLDRAFTSFSDGLESYELFRISLERMQGAIAAGDFDALTLQRNSAENFLTGAEDSFRDAGEAFRIAQDIFTAEGIGVLDSDPLLINRLQDDVRASGLPTELVSEIQAAGFGSDFLASLENDILNAKNFQTNLDDFSIDTSPTLLANLSNSYAFSSILQDSGTTNVPEPSTLILLLILPLLVRRKISV